MKQIKPYKQGFYIYRGSRLVYGSVMTYYFLSHYLSPLFIVLGLILVKFYKEHKVSN